MEETTVGQLGTQQVGIGNIVDDHGFVCQLAPQGKDVFQVKIGDHFEAGEILWEVEDIKKDSPALGRVIFKPLRALGQSFLDFSFTTECPLCEETAGWNGEVEKTDDEISLVMHCSKCQNHFALMKGSLQDLLKKEPPSFVPGRKRR
jgi:hypothetical protein